MVDPDVPGPEYGDPITVRSPPVSIMCGAWPHIGITPGHTVVDVDVVDDHIGYILYGYAGTTGNVHVGASSIYGLKAVHDQLFLEAYEHVPWECDPERLCLDHCVT